MSHPGRVGPGRTLQLQRPTGFSLGTPRRAALFTSPAPAAGGANSTKPAPAPAPSVAWFGGRLKHLPDVKIDACALWREPGRVARRMAAYDRAPPSKRAEGERETSTEEVGVPLIYFMHGHKAGGSTICNLALVNGRSATSVQHGCNFYGGTPYDLEEEIYVPVPPPAGAGLDGPEAAGLPRADDQNVFARLPFDRQLESVARFNAFYAPSGRIGRPLDFIANEVRDGHSDPIRDSSASPSGPSGP